MKYLIAALAAAALMLLGAPAASAINPVDCVFNPAVVKAHPLECKGYNFGTTTGTHHNAFAVPVYAAPPVSH